MTDDEAEEAKERISTAIREYYSLVAPGEFVTDWALTVHRVSDELDNNNQSIVGLIVPTGQRFHITRGLLDVALNMERRTA